MDNFTKSAIFFENSTNTRKLLKFGVICLVLENYNHFIIVWYVK